MKSLRSIGPALIVASVVLGPGSILTASRVGCDTGYDLTWVLAGAVILMIAMTVLSMRLGLTLKTTPCDAIAERAGRPAAVAVGGVLFLVVASFQFSNNLGVLAALRPLLGEGSAWPVIVLLLANGAALTALFGLRRLYRAIERLMKLLVGLMLLGFVGNLWFARPSIGDAIGGLVPSLPDGVDALPVVGLIGTTFSVAGAFYQAYLVKKKGWGPGELARGHVDAVVGIAVLGALSVTVLWTAAAVLHGRVDGSELKSASDVATQLRPLFGPTAEILFCVGLFAGAVSSFLVNAMIGGTVLADGLGLGGDMDGRWPKAFTAGALVAGMAVALAVLQTGEPPVNLIIFAQALTVLGNPVLAGVLIWLSLKTRPQPVVLAVAIIGFLVVVALAIRTAIRIYQQVAA